MLKKLNLSNVPRIQDKPVKVLQFGKGNFLRGFADWMVDMLNERTDFNGGIQIVQSNSTETDQRFNAQDCLYHVVTNGIRNGVAVREIRLVRSVGGLINPFADREGFLKAGENSDLQVIISNTTEAGITFNPADSSPEVISKSFAGNLTSLLWHRYRFFEGDPEKAVAILPCELIEENGEVLRKCIGNYIAHWRLDKGFKTWINEHTIFCNTLVDRIVPGFPKENATAVWEETGYQDELLVAAEPYHLWVIQPTVNTTLKKLHTMFPLEKAGLNVRFVNNLVPYRLSKVRILNGAHTCMAMVGLLGGVRTVREAINDPITGGFIREAIHEEIIPTLDQPENELRQFAREVLDRFQNPFIQHELKSIALNSVSKFQVRVLPSLLEYHDRTSRFPDRLARSLAALIVFYKGVYAGRTMPVNDTADVLDFFKSTWSISDPRVVVQKVLSNEVLWKTDLVKVEGLSAVVEKHVRNFLEVISP